MYSLEEILPQPRTRWTLKKCKPSEMKPPENLEDLQSFLGLVTQLNRFSPALADLTTPLKQRHSLYLRELTTSSMWRTLISPKLALFSPTHPRKEEQFHSKNQKSKTLIETEQCYSNIERELLSVVFVVERFHH